MTKLGRNNPCHCGSGKKYKKCCMNKDVAAEKESAAQRFTQPLMDNDISDEELLEQANEHLSKYPDDMDFENLFPDVLDEDILDDDLPELSEEDGALIDEWWDKYMEIEDVLTERQYLEGFMEIRPDLILHLELHNEVLFDMGAEYMRLSMMDEHILFLIRIRKEFPESYEKSFGYYDFDIIAWLIYQNRLDEISHYLNYFIEQPLAFSDKLIDMLALFQAKNLYQLLMPFLDQIFESKSESDLDEFLDVEEIVVPKLCDIFSQYLKPGFSDSDIQKVIDEVKELKTDLPDMYYESSFWESSFAKTIQPYKRWEIPNPPTRRKISELYTDVSNNYMYFLKEKNDISWVTANYYAMLMRAYLHYWYNQSENTKNKLWDFSNETLELQTTNFISRGGFRIDVMAGLPFFNALYYFADYLLQCSNIDENELVAIQSKCAELFGKLQSTLKEFSVEAFAFTSFPEWHK